VRSAASIRELVSLTERVDTRRPIWFAALVPGQTRRLLAANPRFGAAASVSRMAGAISLGPGLDADLVAELSNEADAKALVAQIDAFTRDAKTNPQILILGLGSYVQAVSAVAEGPNVRLRLGLAAAQVKDLLSRLAAFARLRKH
jgi:hypothetical protein